MKIKTQSSSTARIKNDGFTNDTLIEMYQNYYNMNVEQFRQWCIALLDQCRGKREKTIAIIESVKQTKDKPAILKKTNDYILAGMGSGI